jgi:hypothetical protein
MPFTVDDFEDLLRLLYERPEWRNRLRELILPPELFELPRIAQELAEANRAERERVAGLEAEQHTIHQELREGFAQTGERLDRVEGGLGNVKGRLEGVEGSLDNVKGRLEGVEGRLEHVETDLTAFRAETNARFDAMDQRFDRIDRRFDLSDIRMQQTNTDLGTMKGISMEARYRERVPWFRHLAPGPVALMPAEVSKMIDLQVAAGRLSQSDGQRIELADLILRGGESGSPTYLIVEVSWLVDEGDVRRAHDRATLLRKAGYKTQGVVAGQRIQDDALVLAERLGVEHVIEDEREGQDLADDDQR